MVAVAVDLTAATANRTVAAFLVVCKTSEREKSFMRRANLHLTKSYWAHLRQTIAAAILLTACMPTPFWAQQQGQKTFSSPEEASNALVTAAQNNDQAPLLEILGPGGKQIISSGDEHEDAYSRATFVERYREMHRLVNEPDGTTVLYIGAHNWPWPIPLVNKDNVWYFDTEAGKKEILFRRIGRNEMSAIHVCRELVAAEKEYYATQGDQYAQKILSDPGQHNGLYWRAADGQPESPIGPLVASAVAEGYTRRPDGAPTPYRGYYYRILTRQGKNSLGGAKSYVVNDKMTGGFAFVAYPAEYRSSGVMTFVVGEDGVVHQKDLGKNTAALARAMRELDVDATWGPADAAAEADSGE